MKRRQFFGYAAATVASPAVAVAATAFREPKDHLSPERDSLYLATNNESSKTQPLGTLSMQSSNPTHETVLSVGKDNRLWTKVDGQWYRISIEKD